MGTFVVPVLPTADLGVCGSFLCDRHWHVLWSKPFCRSVRFLFLSVTCSMAVVFLLVHTFVLVSFWDLYDFCGITFRLLFGICVTWHLFVFEPWPLSICLTLVVWTSRFDLVDVCPVLQYLSYNSVTLFSPCRSDLFLHQCTCIVLTDSGQMATLFLFSCQTTFRFVNCSFFWDRMFRNFSRNKHGSVLRFFFPSKFLLLWPRFLLFHSTEGSLTLANSSSLLELNGGPLSDTTRSRIPCLGKCPFSL